jgi:hypothetical protein
MTQQIRQKVFETNSSSSHSLVMESSQMIPAALTKAQLREGVVSIRLGDYGWQYERLYRPLNKASYLLTYLVGSTNWQTTEEVCEEFPGAQMLVDAFRNRFGVALKFEPSYGYVDHEATEHGVADVVFQDQAVLESFLFDEAQYIQLGNDNSPAPWEMPNDKGPRELTYAYRMHEVPKNYVPLKLEVRRARTPGGIRGYVVVKALRKTLSYPLRLQTDWLDKLLKEGRVSKLDATFYEQHSGRKNRGEIVDALDRNLRGRARENVVNFATNVTMEARISRPDGNNQLFNEVLNITLMLPPQVREDFKSRVHSPAWALALALARENLAQAQSAHERKWGENTLEKLQAAEAALAKAEKAAQKSEALSKGKASNTDA